MKEKIKHFSQGKFEYELPFLSLSEDEIHITVEAGKIFEGSLQISNSKNRSMKGVLYSSSRLLTFVNPCFEGTDNAIIYHFNATSLLPGDSIWADVDIVSDCGEQSIKFEVLIEAPFCITSIGKVKDLFQFTDLARTNWVEAKKVFRSDKFEKALLWNDESYRTIYRNLISSISTSQALEEFLVAIHKKSRINLSIDKTNVQYTVTKESFMDKLTLTKDCWGYLEIKLSTDAPFIKLEQKLLWADRFVGNTNEITYVIDPKGLRYGKNFGRIWIKTLCQIITVDIICTYHKEDYESKKKYKQFPICLTDNYLKFRLNNINLDKYMEETETLLKEWKNYPDELLRTMLQAHLSIISGNKEEALKHIGELSEKESAIKAKSDLYYCAYHYLQALYAKEVQSVKKAAKTIRDYYENAKNDWRILWFLLYIDQYYGKMKANKLEAIRDQFHAGCHSPILYYEAVCVYNEEPYLLRELDDFEIQALNFGIKNWFISKDTALQYTYLANKKKAFHPVIFKGLVNLYDEYNQEQILSAICCILIKGFKRSGKYFEWYRRGVEAQLRITELYEYYMYSAGEDTDGLLAMPVYHYFIYNNNLNDYKKAFLYANIIKNKTAIADIYHSYYKKIEAFTGQMLEAHAINRNLVILYQEFIDKKMPGEMAAKLLPYVLYRKELICNNPDICSVVVVHEQLCLEDNYQLTDGRTQVNIFSEDAKIFLVDFSGNRLSETMEYRLETFLNPEEYENTCLAYSNHPMLLLHLYDRYKKNRVMNETSIEVRKQVLKLEKLKPEYYGDCLLELIEYYYENYEEELLEHYLDLLEIHKIRQESRIRVIELYLLRGMNQKALSSLKEYGYEEIAVNRLLRLCSFWLWDTESEVEDEFMLTLCYYIFFNGKYDESVLSYLVKFYNGPTDKMYQLWLAAKNFDLNTHRLEESLLTQMLFSESYVQDSLQVFREYYKNVTNSILVRAFLTFYAYKYLIHDRVISPELFPIIKRELNYEENDIYLLAWLKYQSDHTGHTDAEISYIEYSINNLVKKKIILPFYQKFKKYIKLPESIADKSYVEYRTDPGKQVYIHYSLLEKTAKEEYITEKMPNIFMGIHCKEFVLFYHEILQYYITEEFEDEVNVTESFQICCEKDTPEEESKYNQINLMLITQEMQEEGTLIDMMEHYIRTEYIISQCFHPIE